MNNQCNPRGPFNLIELQQISGAEAVVPSEQLKIFYINNVANLETATLNDLCVLHNKKYLRALEQSSAGACLIHKGLADYVPAQMIKLIHPNPYKAFALIAQAFYPLPTISAYRSERAFIDETAQIGEDCRIEHGCYIGAGAIIGHRTKIGVNAYIGDSVVIGNDCVIESQASISNTVMGNQVVIYTGARIGQDGFGFASDITKFGKRHYKIPHIGKVIIGDHVEIGANTCIDRGSLGDTIIGDHCRIDNLVQIGHNVTVGDGTIIAGQCGIAGSAKIGKSVVLAGQVGVSGHLTIGDNATALAKSGVVQDINSGARVGGYPAIVDKAWHRQTITLKKTSQKKA